MSPLQAVLERLQSWQRGSGGLEIRMIALSGVMHERGGELWLVVCININSSTANAVVCIHVSTSVVFDRIKWC